MTETHTADSVTVHGEGSVYTVPENFTINIGIEAQRGTVREAYAAATQALNAVHARLLSLSVARDSIASTALDARAETRWAENGGSTVTGYTVSSTLAVLLRYHDGAADHAGAADVIAAVVDSGNDCVRLHGLSPAPSDDTAARDAARTLAWAEARRAAELYAGLAGLTLGAVRSIAEGGPEPAGPRPMMARAVSLSADAAMRVEPGQGNVTAEVSVTWELLPPGR